MLHLIKEALFLLQLIEVVMVFVGFGLEDNLLLLLFPDHFLQPEGLRVLHVFVLLDINLLLFLIVGGVLTRRWRH